MNGLRALNYYMLVERERWQGSPITRHATLRPDYAPFYQDLARLFKTYPLYNGERSADCLLMFNFDIGRHAAAQSTLHYAHVDLLGLPRELGDLHPDLGLTGDPHIESDYHHPDSWIGSAFRTMSATGRDYDVADTHIAAHRLAKYKSVYVPSIGFMDEGDQTTLLAWVEGGGRLVIGPVAPAFDPYLRPTEGIAAVLAGKARSNYGRGEIVLMNSCELAPYMEESEPPPRLRPSRGEIQFSLHHLNGSDLLYAANPTAQPLSDTLTGTGKFTLKPVWGGGTEIAGDGSVDISLPPYTVHIWNVTMIGGSS